MTWRGVTKLGAGEVGGDGLRGEVYEVAGLEHGGADGDVDIGAQDDDGAVAGDDGLGLDAFAGGEGFGGADGAVAAEGDFPGVAAIDVVLVGVEDEGLAVGAEGDVLDLKVCAGREFFGFSAGGGSGVEMEPAVALPGEDDAVAGSPVELVERVGLAEGAALAFGGAPGFMGFAGGDVGDANGPGQRGAMGDEEDGVFVGRDAEEGNVGGVRRPDGAEVLIGGGVEVGDRAGGDGVDGDEAVVVAVADEGEVCAVRGPAEVLRGAAGLQKLLGLGGGVVEADGPELAVEEVGDGFAVRGDGGRVAFAEEARFAA